MTTKLADPLTSAEPDRLFYSTGVLLEAADFVADRLARLGVEAALTEAGAVAGDDVRIGGLVFDFRPLEEEDPH